MSRRARDAARIAWAVEVIRVPDATGRLVTLLRDGERVATRQVVVEPPLDLVIDLLDGRLGAGEIAEAASLREAGVEATEVEELLDELEAAALLDGPTRAARRRALERAFAASSTRPAAFAGAAYHDDPVELGRFVDEECLACAPATSGGPLLGLVAPHMDLWRASHGYGRSYGALRARLPAQLATVVVLGTCHAGMSTPFALTTKDFATPFGVAHTDAELARRVAARAGHEVFADEYKHKGEHSIEFQLLFLQRLLADRFRSLRFLPVLCGLGRAQRAGVDPARDRETERVIEAMLRELEGTPHLVVAGADLAHVGPRFGDPAPLDRSGRDRLAARDHASLSLLVSRQSGAFFEHVTEDASTRRVCGTGPLYTLERLLAERAGEGALLGYTQHVDPQEGSIVSHASVAFEAARTESA